MKTLKRIVLGLFLGAVFGGLAGVAIPETRSQPVTIAIVAAVGAIFGFVIGLIASLVSQPGDDNPPETLDELARGRGGVLVGVLAIVGSIVWFVAGIGMGRIYFYPPILLVFGIVALGRGIAARRMATVGEE